MRIRLFIIMLLLGAVLAGCTAQNTQNTSNGELSSNNQTPMPAVNPTAQVTATPTDEAAADTADFTGTTGVTDKRNINIKANGVMSAVRTARHGNYDRVVFEFLGTVLPGYHIEYIRPPVTQCGSGNTVMLAGRAQLEVRFTDAAAHTPEGDATIKERARTPNLPVIKEIKITCDFEAEVTWVLGVASPNAYRVIELKNPTRLAVDIKN